MLSGAKHLSTNRDCSWPEYARVPGIDFTFQGGDILCLVITVAIRRVFGDDLIDGHTSPLRNIEIADKLIPLLKAVYPAIHLRVSPPVLIDTGPCRNAAQISKRFRYSRFTGGAEETFVHKEGQRVDWIDTISH